MRYDFRKLQRAIDLSGKTYKEVEELCGVDETTVCRVLRTNRASKSTAVKLTSAFAVPMADILVKEQRRRTA